MSERDIIVVDTETTGLDIDEHTILEVAAINLSTGEELHFVPRIHPVELNHADPMALAINRYYERRLFEKTLDGGDTNESWRKLYEMLQRNTLAGSNPSFDAAMLRKVFGAKFSFDPAPWHHRFADLSAYAAGALRIPLTALPGLDAVLSRLGIVNEAPHSALGDARATAEAFRVLMSQVDA